MIGDLLDQARLNANLFRATLDNLAVAVVLTDAAGRILYSNSKADGLLVQEAPIYSRRGFLYVQNKLANTALLDAIAGAAGPEIDLGTRGIGLPISGRDDAPAVAYVLPLSNRTVRAEFMPACAAVFISMTTSARPLPEAVLTSLFDLTPGEARVFVLISSGLTTTQTAISLNISENTVKTHLTRIYSKTNTMRQSDLVRLNSAIGAPLRLP
jgi:DNA-binding CsgD family transcriptional regulator